MYCNNCGKEIKDGAKFCPYCGSEQAEAAPPVVPRSVIAGLTRNPYCDTNGFRNKSGMTMV